MNGPPPLPVPCDCVLVPVGGVASEEPVGTSVLLAVTYVGDEAAVV